MMGYTRAEESRLATDPDHGYFCGKCILKLRGWIVQTEWSQCERTGGRRHRPITTTLYRYVLPDGRADHVCQLARRPPGKTPAMQGKENEKMGRPRLAPAFRSLELFCRENRLLLNRRLRIAVLPQSNCPAVPPGLHSHTICFPTRIGLFAIRSARPLALCATRHRSGAATGAPPQRLNRVLHPTPGGPCRSGRRRLRAWQISHSYPVPGGGCPRSRLGPFSHHCSGPQDRELLKFRAGLQEALVTAYAHRRDDGGVVLLQREAFADPREEWPSGAFNSIRARPCRLQSRWTQGGGRQRAVVRIAARAGY